MECEALSAFLVAERTLSWSAKRKFHLKSFCQAFAWHSNRRRRQTCGGLAGLSPGTPGWGLENGGRGSFKKPGPLAGEVSPLGRSSLSGPQSNQHGLRISGQLPPPGGHFSVLKRGKWHGLFTIFILLQTILKYAHHVEGQRAKRTAPERGGRGFLV